MTTAETIQSVNAWADHIESLPRKAQDLPSTISPRQHPELYALRKAAGAAIAEVDGWAEVSRTDAQHLTLQAPDGTLVLYDASGYGERLTVVTVEAETTDDTEETTPVTMREYCAKWNRTADNNFAAACIEQNSDQELEDAARASADTADMETWGIEDPQEWYDAITTAIYERGSTLTGRD